VVQPQGEAENRSPKEKQEEIPSDPCHEDVPLERGFGEHQLVDEGQRGGGREPDTRGPQQFVLQRRATPGTVQGTGLRHEQIKHDFAEPDQIDTVGARTREPFAGEQERREDQGGFHQPQDGRELVL
jgi:hypothetical protein